MDTDLNKIVSLVRLRKYLQIIFSGWIQRCCYERFHLARYFWIYL